MRQQFSTPENIACRSSRSTLFRRLKAVFGPDADVGFREQGYLILASPGGAGACWPRTWRCSSRWAPTSRCWRAGRACAAVSLARDGGVAAGAFGRSGEGWFDPPSLAALFRKAAKAQGVEILQRSSDRQSRRAASRIEAVRLKGGDRIACGALVNAAGPWAGELAAMAGVPLPVEPRKRYVYVIDCREATEALHRAPLTVDPSGVWFRPEGRLFLCGKSPEESAEPPAVDLDSIDHAFFDSEVWPQLAARVPAFESLKVVNAWAGYYDYQHARPQRRHRPRTPRSPTSISPTASRATARSRPRAPATRWPS